MIDGWAIKSIFFLLVNKIIAIKINTIDETFFNVSNNYLVSSIEYL